MKLNALQALVAAIEDGSLRKAGKRLGYTQPALTKMIKDLELELAAPLLVRNTRGVIPTVQGNLLLEHARRVNKEIVQATEQIAKMGGVTHGELNIAAVPAALMLLIPEALRTFVREFPAIRLRVTEEMYMEQLQPLRSGVVDIAVGGIPDGFANGEFHIEELMATTMVVIARKGSVHARARSLRDLARANWVYTSKATDSGHASSLFAQYGLDTPPSVTVVNSTLGLIALIANADYVGMMPAELMRHPMVSEQLEEVRLEQPGLSIKIGAIIRSASSVAPAVQYFIAHLHRAARHYVYDGLPQVFPM